MSHFQKENTVGLLSTVNVCVCFFPPCCCPCPVMKCVTMKGTISTHTQLTPQLRHTSKAQKYLCQGVKMIYFMLMCLKQVLILLVDVKASKVHISNFMTHLAVAVLLLRFSVSMFDMLLHLNPRLSLHADPSKYIFGMSPRPTKASDDEKAPKSDAISVCLLFLDAASVHFVKGNEHQRASRCMAGKQIKSNTFPNPYPGRKRKKKKISSAFRGETGTRCRGAEEGRPCLVAVTNS